RLPRVVAEPVDPQDRAAAGVLDEEDRVLRDAEQRQIGLRGEAVARQGPPGDPCDAGEHAASRGEVVQPPLPRAGRTRGGPSVPAALITGVPRSAGRALPGGTVRRALPI